MILFKRLWLSQVASLDDPFEGALGAKVRQKDWQEAMQSLLFHAVKQPPPGNAKQVSDEYARQEAARLLDDLEHSLPAQKLNTYVNCWHIARHESVLMWKVYAKDRPDSVCIKTNLANIRRCLDDQFHVGVVNYIDFRSEPPDINWPFLYKRAAYLQESEARIFVRCPNSLQWGFHVDIDPAVLIEEVLISPEAPVWMTENITRVIELSGVPIACRVSDLSEEPF